MTAALIETNGLANWVLSDDGTLIYVARDDGSLTIYDAASGNLINTILVGQDLGALALSPDGTQLAIVEEMAANVQQSSNWPSNSADVSFYILDLGDFSAEELVYTVSGSDFTFADVEWSDADTIQLSQNILEGWSGWAPLSTVELSTLERTEHSSYYAGTPYAASLNRVPDSDVVMLGQLGLSSAEYFLISPDGNAFASNGIYEDGVYGYADGIEAASGTGADDYIVIVTGGGAHLYDGTMAYLTNIANLYPDLGFASGVAFSEDGSRIYFLDSRNEAIKVLDTTTLMLVAETSMPGVDFNNLRLGEEIVLTSDGSGIYFNTTTGIGFTSIAVGTNGDDVLRGTANDDVINGFTGYDTIYGLGADDIIDGHGGNDRLFGNDGHDTIFGGSGEDAMSGGDGDDWIDGGFGSDTIYGGSGNDVISGSSHNDFIGGNDGDDTLNGDRGADNIRGGRGGDTINGGDGDDRIYGEEGADTISGGIGEDYILAGTGNDLVNGGWGNDFIRGQDGDDRLAGALGDDSIGGGAGNDRIRGGLGNDVLAGNSGFDTFVFDEALGAGNVDFITDFAVSEDTIELNLSIFSALSGGALAASAFHVGSQATSADHRIIYDDVAGALFYDADGSGSDEQVQFARIGTGLALSADDFDLASAQEPLAMPQKLPIMDTLPELLTADTFTL